jgi:hypothetical protein
MALPKTEQEFIKISKTLLQRVDISNSKREVPSKESQGVEIIRKMKREKALKILRAYRAHKFRTLIGKRIAARMVCY